MRDIMLSIVLLALCACKSTEYVPLQESRATVSAEHYEAVRDMFSLAIERLSRSSEGRETVRVRDSIVTVVNDKGEVVTREIIRERDRDYTLTELESVMSASIDSIVRTRIAENAVVTEQRVEIPVPVEARLTAWQRTKLKAFPYLLGAAAVLAAWAFRKPIMNTARKYI